MDIDVRAASLEALMTEIGKAFSEKIRQQDSIADFVDRSGVPRATLYRFFGGENIGLDNFIRILRALDRMDIILAMIEKPEPTPLEMWAMRPGK